MNRSMFAVSVSLLSVVTLLAGCGSTNTAATSPPSSSNTGSKTNQSSLHTIRIAYPHWGIFSVTVPYYVAEKEGFFKKAGIKVVPYHVKGGGSTVQTVIADKIDLGLETGAFSVLAALEKGAPLKIVGATMTGLDPFWYVKASSPIKSWKGLAGKKVGYSEPGSSTNMGALGIADMLKKAGLKPAVPVAVGGPPTNITDVKTGQITSGWSAAPIGLTQIANGSLRVVIKGNQIPEYQGVTTRVMFANASFVKNHGDVLKAYLTARKQAWDWMFAHKDQAVKIWKTMSHSKLPTSILIKSFNFYTPAMEVMKPISGMNKVISDAIKFKYLKQKPTQQQLNSWIDLSDTP